MGVRGHHEVFGELYVVLLSLLSTPHDRKCRRLTRLLPFSGGGCMNPMYEDQVVGRDCTIIPGQKTVSCVEGVCQVQACQSGWYASKDKQACYEKYDEGD